MSFAAALTLGHPDTATHEAAAAAVLRVLEANDLEADIVAAPLTVLLDRLAAGTVDLLATLWLPSPGNGVSAAGLDLLAGSLYRPMPVCAVPAAAFAGAAIPAELSGIEAVLVSNELAPLAGPCLAAAGISTPAPEILDAEAFHARAEAAIAAARPVLLLLSQPHPLLRGDALRVLRDPDGLLPGPLDARLVLRPGLRAALDPDLVDELEALTLGNPVVSAMEQAMRRDGMSATDAAEAWQRGKLTPRG